MRRSSSRLPICTGVSSFSSRRLAGKNRNGPNSVHLPCALIMSPWFSETISRRQDHCHDSPPAAVYPCQVAQNPESRGTNRSTILALLMLVYTFNFIDRMIIVTLGQAIKVDLQITDAQLGLLQGLAFAVFFTTLGIPLARLAERFSRVNIIAICLALWSGMTVLCGTAANYTQLFLYRMGVGVGEAGCSPPAHSLITDLYAPGSRATALSIYSLGIPLGMMFGAMAGGWIADELGWRQAFVIVGLPGVVLAVLFKMVVKEPPRGLADRRAPPTWPRRQPPLVRRRAPSCSARRHSCTCLLGATRNHIRRLRHRDFHAAVFSLAPLVSSYTQVGLIFGLIGARRRLRASSSGALRATGPASVPCVGTRSFQDSACCWRHPAMSWHLRGILPSLPWRAWSSRCCSITCTSARRWGSCTISSAARMRATATALFIFVVNLRRPWGRPVRHRQAQRLLCRT